jgi:tRNA U55 pseudouridine synthase TruB
MSALSRTAIGCFHLVEAIDPASLTAENLSSHVVPPLHAVKYLPQVDLTPQEVVRLRNGLTIDKRTSLGETAEYAGITPGGELCSILVPRGKTHLTPTLNFPLET